MDSLKLHFFPCRLLQRPQPNVLAAIPFPKYTGLVSRFYHHDFHTVQNQTFPQLASDCFVMICILRGAIPRERDGVTLPKAQRPARQRCS